MANIIKFRSNVHIEAQALRAKKFEWGNNSKTFDPSEKSPPLSTRINQKTTGNVPPIISCSFVWENKSRKIRCRGFLKGRMCPNNHWFLDPIQMFSEKL
jgi:hypothetical protein